MLSGKELCEYLRILYNATYLPIHYYQDRSIVQSFPDWGFYSENMDLYLSYIIDQAITYDYFTTNEFMYFAVSHNSTTNESVVIGPVSSTPITKDTVTSMINKYHLPEEIFNTALEFFQRTPLFSISQFLNLLSLINNQINGEFIDITDEMKLNNNPKEMEVGLNHSNSLVERKENENYHTTYFFEQEYYGYVERGDVSGLEHFLRNVPAFTEGQVAEDSLRQSKNIFITSVSLATRHAIAGGLDIETAYQLSDSYIQEVEKMTDSKQVTILNGTAIFDYTKRVAESKIPMGMSKEIYDCIQYISNHVNQNISVEEVADFLNMDRTTLSKKFKRELGFNISNYITRRKLEEARSLLHYTQKSLSEISEYLCFSSQSYFQNVFKKKYGVTPREYRKSISRN